MKTTKKIIIHRSSFFALFFFIVLLLHGCGVVQEFSSLQSESLPCLQHPWPHEKSDLKPDPAIRFGRLDNGLRYVLFKNKEPQNRVSLLLNVQAGSLHETEGQQGLAHYLEHLLFNGTTHFPPGTLVKYFQSIGMGFGGDTNAHTSYDETVYKLQLPDTRKETLEKGLLVLADYAQGALLLEEEVERERGVILAEKRARDSVGYRVRKEQRHHEFTGTLIPKREVIGVEDVLLTATAKDLRSFYDSWYRPDNMVVVVVGDVAMETMEPLIEHYFSRLQATGAVAQCPQPGKVLEKGTDVLYLHEPELGYARIAISTVFNAEKSPDTSIRHRERLHENVAMLLLGNRLQKLVRTSRAALTDASSHGGSFLQRYGYAAVTASLEGDDWQQGLGVLKQTLDQALDKGFYPYELDRVKKNINASLRKQVQTTATRNSMALAHGFVRKINDNEVILSPEQEFSLYSPLVAEMRLDEVNQALRKIWQHERRLVELVGGIDLGRSQEEAEQLILETFERRAQGQPLDWQNQEARTFPYLEKPPQAGEVLLHQRHEQIGVETILLAGGVQLNIKKTEYKQNQVQVAAHFGTGKLSEPRPGMAMVAEKVVRESGVGGLTVEQLKEALAGRSLHLDFQVGPQSFSFSGGSLSSELEPLFQLLYAYLHDPAFRRDAFERSQAQLQQMYDRMNQSVEGRLRYLDNRYFTSNNPFFSMPAEGQIKEVTLAEVGSWLRPVFQQAELEVNVVGDIVPAEVIELARYYFGAEKRVAEKRRETGDVAFPAGQRYVSEVATSIDKDLVTVAWKTSDFWDIEKSRLLHVLSAVLDNRLRVKLREEMGVVYSPRVYNFSSQTFQGFGVLRCLLTLDPEKVEEVVEITKNVAVSLTREDISNAELARSLQPILTSVRDTIQSNQYWLGSVLALSGRYPQKLEWPLTLVESFEHVTPIMIRHLAATYLAPGNESVLLIKSHQNGSADNPD